MKKIFIISAIACCIFSSCKSQFGVENCYVGNYVRENVSENCVVVTTNGFYNEYTDTITNKNYIAAVGREGHIVVSLKN